MNESDEVTFRVLARAAERRISEFSVPDLANIEWAFAKVRQADENLFTASAKGHIGTCLNARQSIYPCTEAPGFVGGGDLEAGCFQCNCVSSGSVILAVCL